MDTYYYAPFVGAQKIEDDVHQYIVRMPLKKKD